MEPFLNKEITGAQLPFLMKFERVEGIATMQYKLFSPHDTWLPKPPNLTIVVSASSRLQIFSVLWQGASAQPSAKFSLVDA